VGVVFLCEFLKQNSFRADSNVLTDTLIDLLLHSFFGDDHPEHASLKLVLPRFECYHPFENFPLADAFITIMNRHSSIMFTHFHTLQAQKSDHVGSIN